MFSGEIEIDQWHEMGSAFVRNKNVVSCVIC